METIFDLAQLSEKVRRQEAELQQDSFWDKQKENAAQLQALAADKKCISQYFELKQRLEDVATGLELLAEEEDEELQQELGFELQQLEKILTEMELESCLSGEYDKGACILSLTAGAGGTDAQDWAEMLMRMYLRYCEKRGFVVDIVEENIGDEAGIKSITFKVSGSYAYGFLKQEAGVHRLVRLSPFNANNKRQTSFAALDVMPQVTQKDLAIDPKDIQVDTFRASGAGGQHVNKTDSAVRVTHLPTKITATCQNSRSQLSNRQTAMDILSARLYSALEVEHKATLKELQGIQKEIAWGNQIRSYVFHPYKLVKDLRTNVELSDLGAVMDGDLDKFIYAMLLQKTRESSKL